MFDNVDTHKTITEARERNEAVAHADGANARHARLVPIAAALLAVIAAIASLLSNKTSTEALALKNEAILLRTEASDSYNFYESRSVKEHIYEAAIDANPSLVPGTREKLLAVATHEKIEKAPLLERAQAEEESANAASRRSERLSKAHEVMESGVTLFEVSIAIVSISALTSSSFLIGFGAFAAFGGLVLFVYGQMLR